MRESLHPYPSFCHLTTDKFCLDLSRELFKRLALCLRYQEGQEYTRQYEESEDLEAREQRSQTSILTITMNIKEKLTCD